MIGLRLYAAAGVAVVVAGGLGYVTVLNGKLNAAQAAVWRLENNLATCAARNEYINLDRETENDIEDLSLDDLRRRASEWLRP